MGAIFFRTVFAFLEPAIEIGEGSENVSLYGFYTGAEFRGLN